MPTGGYQARRPPAHAGRLRSWERVTITVAFVLVAAAITAIMVLTARPQATVPSGHRHGHGTEQPRPGGAQRGGPGNARQNPAATKRRRAPRTTRGALPCPVKCQAAGTTTVFM